MVDRWFPEYPGGVIPGPLGRIRQMLSLQRRLTDHLDTYDALYVRQHPGAWIAARAAARRGVPVVQECNGVPEDIFVAWPATKMFAPVLLRWQRRQFADAVGVIAVTRGLADRIEAETGRCDVVVSPNGANVDVFRPDAPRRSGLPGRYAVFFGRFAPWQGIDVLLEAVRHREWPADVPLVVVGDGKMRPDVESEARVNDRLIYLGALPYEELAGVVAYAVASMIVKRDPVVAQSGISPLKLYESMACGAPVIVSEMAGLADTVREVGCGLVTPQGDAEAVAQAVARIAGEPELGRTMGAKGRAAAVERYSWDAIAAQRLTVVESAIGATPRGGTA